jgi:hypothetical protein
MKRLDTAEFNQLYFENQSVLNAQFIGSHALRNDVFHEWKKRFQDNLSFERAMQSEESLYDDIQDFLDQFQPIHVSFQDFKSRVHVIVDEMFAEFSCIATVMVLLLPEKVEKSGLWVSLIAWERIKEQLQGTDFEFVVAVETDLKWLEERVENKPDVHMVTMIFDDATYSGTQYAEKTAAFHYQRFVPFTSRYGKWTHAVMIPFVSERAKARIRETERGNFAGGPVLWFPDSATVMPVVQQTDTQRPPIEIPKDSMYYIIFDEKYDSVYKRGMTYFDHKLADNVSVYTFIMKNAPLLSEPLQVRKYDLLIGPSFIEGCGPDTRVSGIEKNRIIDTASHIKPDCFVPPYKRHQWTYKGRNLEKAQTLVQITSECSVCGKATNALFREYGQPETLGFNICSKACQLAKYK